jgi:sugar lactone lactonase YvrE
MRSQVAKRGPVLRIPGREIVLILLAFTLSAKAGSYYTQRLADPKAVYVTSRDSDDATTLLQAAINRVHETTGQGIVFLAEGRYQVTNTLYVWPGIRVIGYGVTRPTIVLPANTPGFQDPSHEKVMVFFAGGRHGFGRGRQRNPEAANAHASVPDANPGTFYSALANVDVEIEDGNFGAVAVRARYAQHCFLAHIDFRLGSALAAVHEAGNVAEDVRCFGGRYGIWTSKPSPGWQFTMIDCLFEGQREAAILEREAGLTLIRPQFRRVPTAVAIEPGYADELWIKDARFEEVSGPALVFGVEDNPRNEVNVEGAACRKVPTFAALRESGRKLLAPDQSASSAETYLVRSFTHGLHYTEIGDKPQIVTSLDARPCSTMPASVPSDLPAIPGCDTWVNVRDLGAKGEGIADDTDVLRRAIANHRAIYLPSGFYSVRDTLRLRPDTVLIGLHPAATQIILPDGTPGYEGKGGPKALIETPRGGHNIVMGIGLYTSGNNPRAVAALWKAGADSMMNDVRFLGGHGTPKPDGSRENPYNADHTADPDPNRRWDSQYPSLWVTDGGGGTFLDLWTPSTFAQAGMRVSDTETEGRVYQMSSEHHMRHEVQIRNAAHWRLYALQTEGESGESGFDLPLEIESSHDITLANLHIYRVISSFQPFPWAVKVSDSRELRFRNLHCYSNSKVSFDAAVYDQTHDVQVREREFAWLDVSGRAPKRHPAATSSVLARGARVEKLAGGFFNISGGVASPKGEFFFIDAHRGRIHRWDPASRQVSTVTNLALQPVNLAIDRAGNLLVVSYAGKGSVYALKPNLDLEPIKPGPVSTTNATTFFLPVSDWRVNQPSLAHPAAHFVSPDGTTIMPAGVGFLEGATSWGVKSSPQIRSFGLAPAVPGQTFYVTDEAELTTWAANVEADGSLSHFRLFANQGGEGVVADLSGHVFIAAGQIYVYSPSGSLIETIAVPERPLQLVLGGPDHKTLFIPARTSLYAVRLR